LMRCVCQKPYQAILAVFWRVEFSVYAPTSANPGLWRIRHKPFEWLSLCRPALIQIKDAAGKIVQV
jgi:hypothetical protein